MTFRDEKFNQGRIEILENCKTKEELLEFILADYFHAKEFEESDYSEEYEVLEKEQYLVIAKIKELLGVNLLNVKIKGSKYSDFI